MSDSGSGIETTSPYDYPRPPLSGPIPPSGAPTEKEKQEIRQTADITIEINDHKSDETRNEEGETELPENNENDEEEREKETEKPLLEEKESVKIEMKPDNEGEDTPTLPLPDKKKKKIEALDIEGKQESKLPKYLFPLTRIKNAWNDSSNVFQFLGNASCIIFQTVGWFTCVGGIPFLSLVMLIIGSIYLNECKIEPNIPVYLIVSGVIGTIQHFIVIWTKYVPKESQGRLKVCRSYCRCINGLFHLFLLIWFILGSVWVYGAHSEVDFSDPQKDEYCHKTLYYFSFWIFNLSYILLGLIAFLSICFFIFLIAADD